MVENSRNHSSINKQHWDALAKRDWAKKAELRRQIRDGADYIAMMEPKISPHLKDIAGKKVIVLQFGDGLLMLAVPRGAQLLLVLTSPESRFDLQRRLQHFAVLA